MLPIDKEKIARDLATLGDRGRAASGARWMRWAEEHPTIPCTHCTSRGCYVERAGARRPYDHRDFDTAKGDQYVATCAACRGLGRVHVTPEEARAHLERETKRTRAAYAKLRTAIVHACEHLGFTSTRVDDLARRRIVGEPTPTAWLRALEQLAHENGVAT